MNRQVYWYLKLSVRHARVCLQLGIFATKLHQRSVFTVGNTYDEIASGSKLK